MVASSDLQGELDLYNLALSLKEVEYEPEQFPGAVLKLREPKVSLLLFRNGKVIISGASSEKEISDGIRKAQKLVHGVCPKIKVRRKNSYEVVNLVASASLNRDLDLFELALRLDNVEYEPEQFPGVVMKLAEPKASFLLFLNGQIICSGIRNETDLRRALNKAKQEVENALKEPKGKIVGKQKRVKKGG